LVKLQENEIYQAKKVELENLEKLSLKFLLQMFDLKEQRATIVQQIDQIKTTYAMRTRLKQLIIVLLT
jgi:hypothetical protein